MRKEEKQYKNSLGFPITKKEYEKIQKRKAESKAKREAKEKERLSKKFHDDGPNRIQKIIDSLGERERTKAATGNVFKYKKGEYKAKIKELNPMVDVDEDMDMKDLMELYKKETDKRKKKKKLETQKYGRPKKKGELEASKGSFIKKKRIGANDYRKGGYVLSTVDHRKK